jgi:hypothetical protein
MALGGRCRAGWHGDCPNTCDCACHPWSENDEDYAEFMQRIKADHGESIAEIVEHEVGKDRKYPALFTYVRTDGRVIKTHEVIPVRPRRSPSARGGDRS